MRRLTFCWWLALATLTACTGDRAAQTPATPIDTIPMLVSQIQKCARLHTAEYRVHKIVTHEDQMKLQGTFMSQEFNITLPVGDRRIAIPIDATLTAYVDFADFGEKNIRRRGKKIEIVLPDPKVELTSSKINHAEIKKQVSLLRANFSDEELASYENQGRAAILNDVPKMGIIDMARQGAAHTLIPMLVQAGFEEADVTVSFRKQQFTIDDLPRLLDNQSLKK